MVSTNIAQLNRMRRECLNIALKIEIVQGNGAVISVRRAPPK
jgi:hypothetical protein